ncbi:glutathione peroxidase [Cohnella hongkongensis]|uniref:Glutathione peroxidase n=1 Tax=Cohnella hongkongensis TaxID=178337 RepID=A0ABV9FE90_9BACL
MSIYDYSTRTAGGEAVSLRQYENRVLLIVNTASECGFTPQYAGLQSLYEAYKDRGVVVLGFPCNQFGGQEPGTSSEVEAFCSLQYGVTFPVMEKLEVTGPNADPLFAYLTSATGGEIRWNFTKFLVDRSGMPVKHYESAVQPQDIGPDIEKLLI